MVYLILCEGPRLSAYDVGCSSLWLILDPASELREFPGSCPLQTEPHQWSLYACSTKCHRRHSASLRHLRLWNYDSTLGTPDFYVFPPFNSDRIHVT